MNTVNERTVDRAFEPVFFPESYFSVIFGDCCAPLIFHGECILASTRAEVRRGDIVSIIARTPGERAGLTNGSVKRFIGWKDGPHGQVLVTEMLNPRRLVVFAAADVFAVHRVTAVFDMGATASIAAMEARLRLPPGQPMPMRRPKSTEQRTSR